MNNDNIKSAVKETYGAIARASSSCCGSTCGCGTDSAEDVSVVANDLYDNVDTRIREAANLGLGCGTPVTFSDITPGMTVLDLGSGGGIDVFLAARQVGPAGKAIGIDMTEAMISKAEANKEKLGIANAEFRHGEIEDLPVQTGSVDRIISNCVINLVPDKRKAFAEMFRVLKPGGKFTVSDIVSVGTVPEEIRSDMRQWASCVSGALDKEDYLSIVREAGFTDLTIVAEKLDKIEATAPYGFRSITLRASRS